MKIEVQYSQGSTNAYAYTGGKEFNPSQPTAIFIHGVLCDHSVWILQSRYLAHHGWNVLALDLPGHCKSSGTPPQSVEHACEFICALIDQLKLKQVALIGHSWGSLIALETAAKLKTQISHLVMVGIAFPMPVSEALLTASFHEPHKALEMINIYSRATLAPVPSALGSGTWVYGASMALGRRVLASNSEFNLFHRGFMACNNYKNGIESIQQITAPALFILGQRDQMTSPKGAQKLIDTARLNNQQVDVVMTPTGHHQMTESPEETLQALIEFLKI
jgi:pimeloyl-ACP methyl ester carboxylesterase